jgi:hypothetical protein
MHEIYNNGKIQILYNPITEEISFGLFPEAFTTLEHLILARAFDLTEDEE